VTLGDILNTFPPESPTERHLIALCKSVLELAVLTERHAPGSTPVPEVLGNTIQRTAAALMNIAEQRRSAGISSPSNSWWPRDVATNLSQASYMEAPDAIGYRDDLILSGHTDD